MHTSLGGFSVSGFLNNPSSIIPSLPLHKPSRFSLDMAGTASLLGGDDAISAITAVHVYGSGLWPGWYNTPGSFQIAKQLNSLFAKSAVLSDKISSKSVQIDPTALLELDTCKGPRYRAARSGTIIEQTGYLSALFMKECATRDSEGKAVPGRRTSESPVGITIAELNKGPAVGTERRLTRSSAPILPSAGIPIVSSIGTCVISALCGDWYAALLILVGIFASGLFRIVLGSADFAFMHPEPAKGSPAGGGILFSDKHIVVLKGTEGAVNSITRGKFSLRFSSTRHYGLIRWCSTLFFIQSITQLLLVPQVSLFGQVMFLTSISVSAFYNARLSSSDKEKIHRRMLFEKVLEDPKLTRYTLGTRVTATVFILLVLQLQDPTNLLDELIPNDTEVWRQWKLTILEWLRYPNGQLSQLGTSVRSLSGFTQQEKDLLGLLYEDARSAYNGYRDYRSL